MDDGASPRRRRRRRGRGTTTRAPRAPRGARRARRRAAARRTRCSASRPGQLEDGDRLLGLLLRLRARARAIPSSSACAPSPASNAGIEIDARARPRAAPRAASRAAGSSSRAARSSRPAATRASVVASSSRELRRARCGSPSRTARSREPPERHELAARADRLRQRAEVVRDQHDHRVRRRLLEILEQRVGGVLVHRVGAEDEIDAPRRLEGPHVQVAAQRRGCRRCGSGRRAARARRGRDACRRSTRAWSPSSSAAKSIASVALADAGRAVQEVRVRRPVGERRREERASPRAARRRRRTSREQRLHRAPDLGGDRRRRRAARRRRPPSRRCASRPRCASSR